MAPLASAEIPYRCYKVVNLRETNLDHDHYPGGIEDHEYPPMTRVDIQPPLMNIHLKLRLKTIEIRYNAGTNALDDKIVRIYHRVSADPTQGALPVGYEQWDFQIGVSRGDERSFILDAEKHVLTNDNIIALEQLTYYRDLSQVYMCAGDSLLIVWDQHYDTTANVVVTFTQV